MKNRGIVVATPTAIKSVFLSFIEKKRQLKYAMQNELSTQDITKIESEIKTLISTLKLFKTGVMLLDEVDLLLHPLKSELNFPLGEKFDLDASEDGARWNLVVHLMDAIFFTTTGRVSEFEYRGQAFQFSIYKIEFASSCFAFQW